MFPILSLVLFAGIVVLNTVLRMNEHSLEMEEGIVLGVIALVFILVWQVAGLK